ncbi:amidase [Candidatus Bathyarchaeota archaeon]|nr:amidase [Candidatus Bathyarchaeota archaeon]
MNILHFSSISELSTKIKEGSLSPVELTNFFLERLKIHGPKLNAIVNILTERALKKAKKMETEIGKGKIRSILHGIPYGVKDLIAAVGAPTSWGAAPYKNRIIDYDATVVSRLESSGAILCAKLAMIELAGGMGYRQPNASFSGPCKTPWNLNYWSGGSSSGSGSCVAAGLIPFSIGSETWGSILSPANNCGVAGLRPTYGRVSRHGAMALSWTLDKLGPLCQTAEDCGLVLETIAGFDSKDPSTTHKKYKFMEIHKDFKIALLKGNIENADETVSKNFDNAVKVIEKFAIIEEINFPEFPYEAVTRIILNAEAASAFEDFIDNGLSHELTAPEDKYGGYSRLVVFAKDYLRALRLRGKMVKIAEEIMQDYDAILAPTSKRMPSPIQQEFRRSTRTTPSIDITGSVGNGAGLPSISVPSGFNEEGLPTGIQFMGKAYDENSIISIAMEYQKHTEWHKKHPPEFQ